jgi:hypothetical protein
MDYQYQYDDLIKTYKNRESEVIEDYYETHHIIPLCKGGTNNVINLVKLSAKAHYVAHHLLCMIYPNDYQLACAFNGMCAKNTKNSKREYSARMYQTARKHFSKNHPCKRPEIKQKSAETRNKNYEINKKKRSEKTIIRLINKYNELGVDHDGGYLRCEICNNKIPPDHKRFCGKICHDIFQTENFHRSDAQHQKMVENINKYFNELSEEKLKKHLKNSMHSDKVDMVKKGIAISKAKKGKSTNQYEIMGRRFANMSDEDFENYLHTISKYGKQRSINLRNKWKNILQLEN